MSKLGLVVVMVLGSLTACGSSDGLGEDECGVAVRKVMGDGPKGDSFAKKSPAEQKYRKDMMAEAAKAVAESCRTTKWSKEALACFSKADGGDRKALRACDEMLTPEQQKAGQAAAEEGAKKVKAPEGVKSFADERKGDELPDNAEDAVAKHEAELKAREAAQRAAAEADEAKRVVDKLLEELKAVDAELDAQMKALADAKDAAARDAAQAKLAELQKRKAETSARVAEAKAKAARAERTKGVTISKECMDNPLAKGCM